ncbi:mannose-6-phosphate isomerase, partial [Vibrio parahaemolyticus]
ILFFKNNRNTEGLKYFFIEILSLSGEDKNKALDVLLTFSTQRKQENEDDLFSLILELAESYPNDVGIFAPFFLNV